MTREEAINEIKSWDFLEGKEIEAIHTLIPELAESEDERVRKEIIHYILYKANGVSEKQEHEWIAYLEKQKEQEPIKVIYITKFRSGDTIVSTKNPHLTYIIRKTGIMDESGELCYECEILADGKSDNDIKLLSIEKVDSWGELIEQKEQKSVETWPNLSNCIHDCKNCLAKCLYKKEENPEPKQEWSEEDEDMLNSCICSIEEAKENRYAYKETDGDTSYDHEITWLKSLRPQPKWKPSEDELAKKHLDGYCMGREDTMREMKDFIESHFNCENAKKGTPIVYNTQSGTSTLKAEG